MKIAAHLNHRPLTLQEVLRADEFLKQNRREYVIVEWETYTINITQDNRDIHPEGEMSDVTERFESELYRLVKKYQGRAGLKFDARSSEEPIKEY